MHPPPPGRVCLCLKLRPIVRAGGRDGEVITQISYFHPHFSFPHFLSPSRTLPLPHALSLSLALPVLFPDLASLYFLSYFIFHVAYRCVFVSTCLSVCLLPTGRCSSLASKRESRHFMPTTREIKG